MTRQFIQQVAPGERQAGDYRLALGQGWTIVSTDLTVDADGVAHLTITQEADGRAAFWGTVLGIALHINSAKTRTEVKK